MPALKPDAVAEALGAHLQWVDEKSKRWQKIDAACRSQYWDCVLHRTGPLWNGTDDGNRTFIEINMVRPWISALQSGLLYGKLRTTAKQSAINAGRRVGAPKREAVSTINDEFLARRDIEQVADATFNTGLTYDGGGALFIGRKVAKRGGKATKTPTHLLPYIENLLPSEVVFDRTVTCYEQLQWIGRIKWLSRDDYDEEYGVVPPAADEKPLDADEVKRQLSDSDVGMRRDAFAFRRSADEDILAGKDWVQIFELWDLNDQVKDHESRGALRIFLVSPNPSSTGQTYRPTVREIERIAIPETWPDGEPCLPILPVALEYTGARPLDNIAAAWAIYELNSEFNVAASTLATNFRRDSNRLNLYREGLGDEFKAAIQKGADMSYVKVEGLQDKKLDDLVHPMETPQSSDTLLKYRDVLDRGLARVQLTGQASRGQPNTAGTPLSATESEAIVQGTETQVGRIRARADALISRACQIHLRILIGAMRARGEASLTVYAEGAGKNVTLTIEDMDRPWAIGLVDSIASPSTEARKRADFLQIQGILLDLATTVAKAEAPPPPGQEPTPGAEELARIAKQLYDQAVDLWDLPADLQWSQLVDGEKKKLAAAAPPPPAPSPPVTTPPAGGTPGMPASPAGGGEEPLTPQQQADLNSPVAQAIAGSLQ